MNSVLHVTSTMHSKVLDSLYNTLHVQYKMILSKKIRTEILAQSCSRFLEPEEEASEDEMMRSDSFMVITATAPRLNAVILGTLKVWHFVVFLTRLHSIV